jgi:hypothetical protein
MQQTVERLDWWKKNAKCCCLQKFTCKGTLRQVFYLYESPLPYTTYTCILYAYSYREGGMGGELNREKVRGAIVHKAGRKYQHDWLYLQSINSIKHQWRRHLGFIVNYSMQHIHSCCRQARVRVLHPSICPQNEIFRLSLFNWRGWMSCHLSHTPSTIHICPHSVDHWYTRIYKENNAFCCRWNRGSTFYLLSTNTGIMAITLSLS